MMFTCQPACLPASFPRVCVCLYVPPPVCFCKPCFLFVFSGGLSVFLYMTIMTIQSVAGRQAAWPVKACRRTNELVSVLLASLKYMCVLQVKCAVGVHSCPSMSVCMCCIACLVYVNKQTPFLPIVCMYSTTQTDEPTEPTHHATQPPAIQSVHSNSNIIISCLSAPRPLARHRACWQAQRQAAAADAASRRAHSDSHAHRTAAAVQ